MHDFGFLNSKCAFPKAASAEMAELGLERWHECAWEAEKAEKSGLADFAANMSDNALGRQLLDAVFGNSPFLGSVMLKDPAFVRRLIEQGPDSIQSEILTTLGKSGAEQESDGALARCLRVAKARTALTVALADITGVWALHQVTGALSDFADAALRLATAHVLKPTETQDEFSPKWPDDPERESGLIILALGKLGSKELNYSSDIDLIVLFDPNRIETDDPASLQNRFVRLTKRLMRLIDERTADGYVFRTDLRLRPDPGVTPVALSVAGAETYYESLGQNWERAAMIKARPVAGDIEAGETFLKRLTPFIWRKNLDFAAIQDIQSIKRQIHAHRGGAKIAVAGHNIKLGRGGIREIEFFAQTQQLIWGGREAKLRSSVTCETLATLVDSGHSTAEAVNDLISAYEFLRRLEHRLQMINDEQTQVLPNDPDGIDKIGIFMGYDDAEDFATELTRHLSAVQHHYGDLFDEAPTLGGGEDGVEGPANLVFTGGDPDPETMATLKNMGFEKPEIVDTAVRGWHHGRVRATRSKRAREILTELMPVLLRALAETPSPDVAFLRFDGFLSRLPAGVQLFSMFHANPQLLDLIAEIMGKAPRLADHLSNRAIILDSVLTQDFFDAPPAKPALLEELQELLGRSDYFESKLDISRRWNADRRFQVGVQCLHGTLSTGDASRAYSNIAEVAVAALFPVIEEDFAAKHGRIPGGGLAVVAMGKLGSREMTASSDLDLVFVYTTPGDETPSAVNSDGPQPLDAVRYYARLSQRLINGLTAPTSEGSLYEVDMRLRPSGAKGPIATSLEGFLKYHSQS
ncbi:MAG: bifunctional [glutamine synthetase] adenylyltransferase/[glutamine synthetase]-adenylyl-L-tyrosine phosphorylase, partial [Alphaproteobacteria bacterium]|nr:bifunctional [glutamine synthetase] adenylyltransferase/[glutamine synthetase]-adenylyl-L-tyrosine phosphorylase [Alphaproteobacteria bacterium]